MKIFAISTAALVLSAGSALAQPLLCEREVTRYSGGKLVDTDTLTFYAHGCDAFQYHPLTAHQVANLGAHCELPIYPTDAPVAEEEIEVVEVETIERPGGVATTVTPRGVADGSVHSRDNLTSMGIAASDGQHVLRVRSATNGNPVTIRRAGTGTVWTGTVDAGDTLIGFSQGGTYIATTGSRTITKATGPQTFNDVTQTPYGPQTVESVTTRTVTRPAQGSGELIFARQGGPRTDRCAPLGGSVPPRN